MAFAQFSLKQTERFESKVAGLQTNQEFITQNNFNEKPRSTANNTLRFLII